LDRHVLGDCGTGRVIGQACFGWPRARDGVADERPIWDRHVSATDARLRLGAGY